MREDKFSRANIILYLLGLLPTVWLGLLVAPAIGLGLPNLITNLAAVFGNPFHIVWCEDSLKTVLVFLCAYVIGIIVYVSTARNYRRREEHGSAHWGNAGQVNKKYENKAKPEENKILTQKTKIGLDGHKHRRNLNVLVCGGSGAGKTRFYAKPNIMQANTSFVILDPKGENVRDTGSLLKAKGYDIKVLDLINMDKSYCYNPFTIQEAAFIECPKLKSIVFPNTLKRIESMAFLTESPISVFIPASVREIDANAFFGAGVSKIEVDPHNPMYHCVNNCLIETKRKYLVLCGEGAVLPDDGSVEVIGNGSCNSLLHTSAEAEPYSLTIPEGIKSIEQGAFCFANIKDLTLPKSLIEVGRGDLVGKFVGWTAPTIQKKFRDAQGSVLFIDEAYSLVDDRDGSYGDEAINTIVQEMENHRDDVVVIFAGYPDKMEGFLQKNPGLRSRIAFHVPFADYGTDELCKIANLIAKKKGLKLAEDVDEKLTVIFNDAKSEADFGNGRYVRNIIEKAKMAQATRLLNMDFDLVGKDDIVTICAEDIEAPPVKSKKARNPIGFSVA